MLYEVITVIQLNHLISNLKIQLYSIEQRQLGIWWNYKNVNSPFTRLYYAPRITSYNVCYTKLLRTSIEEDKNGHVIASAIRLNQMVLRATPLNRETRS